jgi:pimeloyl-ACP methyl ester carboxylesterase
LLALVQGLDSGTASVIATSFAPAAAVWAAATRPEAIKSIVAISPHFEADESFNSRLLRGVISLLLRGPWAASVWSRFYQSWYKSRTPDDIDKEVGKLRTMLNDAARRRAARETLIAHRKGMPSMIESYKGPALVIFGAADDHFPDPQAEARRVSSDLHAEFMMVEGAGHYPHVEYPDIVGPAIVDFLKRVTR